MLFDETICECGEMAAPVISKRRTDPYFAFMPATAKKKKKERKMAKLVSITAATALIAIALFPAIYTFVAFA